MTFHYQSKCDNPSPDLLLGLGEVVREVPVELTGCVGRHAAAANEITQEEIVIDCHGCRVFNQGAVSTVDCFSNSRDRYSILFHYGLI